jgi:hypothetical protein
MRKISEIQTLPDFMLLCVFSDGTKKIADLKPYLSREAFLPLKDPYIFASAIRNGDYFVEWKNYEIDLSADTLWHISAGA